jgi:hypothetical protein
MKLSLVGKGPGWERAFRDRDEGRKIWCVSTIFAELKTVEVQPDRVFQLHERKLFEPWIAEEGNRVVLIQADPDFPEAQTLPVKELLGTFGPRFSSTFAWMLGWALVEGFTDITIHGIHLGTESEYFDQRDAFFWFCGFAQGHGVRINIDQDSGVFILNRAYGVPQNV